MTRKRFIINDDIECPIIEGKFELNREEIAELLNKQDEYLTILREELELTDKKNTSLEKRNKQLKQIYQTLKHKNNLLYDEYERLKEEKIKLEIKLDLIRNYAVISGEVEQKLIENIVIDENHNMIIDKLNDLSEENKNLKNFIRKISTNNKIILSNGAIYKIDKVI